MQYRFVESLDWLDTRNIYWYRRDHETAHYKARMRVRDEALKQCDADDGVSTIRCEKLPLLITAPPCSISSLMASSRIQTCAGKSL